MNQVLYRGKVWYAIDTLEGVKLSRGHDIEILTQDEYDYALMRGDVKMLEKKEKLKVIEIKEEVQVGDIILEKGDKIKILENRDTVKFISKDNVSQDQYTNYWFEVTGEFNGVYGLSVDYNGKMSIVDNENYPIDSNTYTSNYLLDLLTPYYQEVK